MMFAKVFTIVALAACSMAVPDAEKRQISLDAAELSVASALGISTLPTNIAQLESIASAVEAITAILPPASILSVLETAVPASVISDLANPTSASVFASEFEAGSTPAWYSSLPANVKSYFATYSPEINTMTSAESSATSLISSVSASESAVAAGTAASSTATSTGASASAKATGAASKVNGAMAASVAGAIGILGLAVGL